MSQGPVSQGPPPYALQPAPAPLPKAPGATLALVLGVVSLGGLFVLVVPVFLAPLACYHAVAARRRIDREPGRWAGAGEAQTGLVLGVIATGLMLVVVGLLALAAGGILIASGYDAGYGT